MHNGYDAFISHNHKDKAFARELAARLANVDFRGRPLRPWLDEKFLDPGDLGQNAELTTALDRSRMLLLVLSPASIASKWVEFELEYFLRDRRLEDIVPLVKEPCESPAILKDSEPIDFTDVALLESGFTKLVERLCPSSGFTVANANSFIDDAWSSALDADPGGFDAEPTEARDALLSALLRFSIDEPATEGLALTGFLRAAQLLLDDHERDHHAAYNMKMLLGECLAVAVTRNARYRQVAQRYLDLETADTEDPILGFVVARAYSKVAEIDPTLVDLGALLRVTAQIDSRGDFNNKKAVVAMMVGRMAAKLRGTDIGDLLIQSLSEGGPAGRIAAIGAISMGEELSPSVFYLTELATMHASRVTSSSGAANPPSRKLQALLFGIELDQPQIVSQQLGTAKIDLRRAFGIDDLPYGYFWIELTKTSAAPHAQRAPFIGTVVKATAANMEEIALKLNASQIVCLTEPRIVEALFDAAGSVLIQIQDENSPQCRRLDSRGVPFAMLDAERMDKLRDGDQIEIEDDCIRIVSKR